MKKSMFVFLVTTSAVVIAAPVAWATAWLVSGKTPSLPVIGVGVVVGLVAGVIGGSRWWDDRNAIRQRAAQVDDS